MQKYGDLNSQYISESSSHIEVDYIKLPGYELGLSYKKYFNTHVGFRIGGFWNNSKIRMNYRSLLFSGDNTTSITNVQKSIVTQSYGVSAGAHYTFSAKYEIGLNLFACGLVLFDSKLDQDFDGGSSSSGFNFSITEKITTEQRYASIVPDFYLSAQISPYFRFLIGTRFKFWGNYDLLSVDVKGYFADEPGNLESVLHHSSISEKDFSYYLGVIFSFPCGKELSPVID